jgi:hypothetical protein
MDTKIPTGVTKKQVHGDRIGISEDINMIYSSPSGLSSPGLLQKHADANNLAAFHIENPELVLDDESLVEPPSPALTHK